MNTNEFPLASFCVIAYKAEKYIAEAIQGAFNQDYPNLEIILSDDGSPDATFDIMKRMASEYKGPHKIILNQNKPNLGPRDHYCKVMYELSHGEFIVLADGDDVSLPTRTSVSVDLMLKHPEISSVSFYSQLINENGEELKSPLFKVSNDNNTSIFTLTDYINYDFYIFSDDSRALRRSVVDSFPPLKYPFAEDIFLFIRCIMVGPIAYIRQPLVQYRQHSDSIMGKTRANRWVSKADKNEYKNGLIPQINSDFEWALKKGIVNKTDEQSLRRKLNDVIMFLRPRNMTIYCIVIRKALRMLSTIFANMERAV